MINFIKNLWFFRKELWKFKCWDYTFNLDIFRRSLEKTAHTLEFYGNEIQETRLKKVEKIKRVIELLNHINSFSYIEMAEKELGEVKNLDWLFEVDDDDPKLIKLANNENEEERNHNKKVYDRAHEMESDEWKEIWRILEGQDHNEYIKLMKSTNEKDNFNLWYKWFDGSGMKHWWD